MYEVEKESEDCQKIWNVGLKFVIGRCQQICFALVGSIELCPSNLSCRDRNRDKYMTKRNVTL